MVGEYEVSKAVRNPAIELYRCMLMLGICVLHAAIAPGTFRVWFINLLFFCVDGFVFITGYYGCRFKPSKVLRLVATGVFCAMVCAKGNPMEAVRIFGGYWFLHAYVLMMVFAPLADKVLETKINLKTTAPLLLAIFIWGFAPALPVIGWIVPQTDGLATHSGITLLGVYILGRMYRILQLNERMNKWWVLVASVAMAGLCAAGANEYNSPCAAILAGCCFFWFGKLKLNLAIGNMVLWIAPSVFAIYLLHQPNIGLQWKFVYKCVAQDWNIYITQICAGLLTFGVCLAIDIPRRIMGRLLFVYGGGGGLSTSGGRICALK